MAYIFGASRERHAFFNSLTGLIKALEGERTTIDLRDDVSVTGLVSQVDGYMNVTISDAIVTDRRGDHMRCDAFFVRCRNIRYVHVPPEKNITDLIKHQLHKLRFNPNKQHQQKPTFKSKRAITSHMETVAGLTRDYTFPTD